MRKEKVQYIHCPECDGIIEMNKDEIRGWSDVVHLNNKPRCRECGKYYDIRIETMGIMKIVITNGYYEY